MQNKMQILQPLCLLGIILITTCSNAQIPLPQLRSGEFAGARRIAEKQSPSDRDSALADISNAQLRLGQSLAAASTLRDIESPESRSGAVSSAGGAAGGAAFADFESLMTLIKSTVAPDTWEDLGGPSTMAEYPQGVFVDPSGTLRECEIRNTSVRMSDLAASLVEIGDGTRGNSNAFVDPLQWRHPASVRCVSLRRLRDCWTELHVCGKPIPESMQQLAGLSQIRYVHFADDDIFIAGEIGGIETHQGWYRDRQTGFHSLRLDFLVSSVSAAAKKQPFGCTIDPTHEGLVNAAAVASKVSRNEIPIGKAADAVRKALGMQRIEVFGVRGDTVLGYTMVEADRHMKQLALGMHPMPDGAMCYLDAIDQMIDRGPPNDLLLRLWFTTSPRSVRTDARKQSFELVGAPIRLSGQNERALANGERGNIANDPRTEKFVESFNLNWHRICNLYPIYGALQSAHEAASVAELIDRYARTTSQRALVESLSYLNESAISPSLVVPKQVESIATMHSVRQGSKRHHVVIASGGVEINPAITLTSNLQRYPSLNSFPSPNDDKPITVQRWWWDL